MSFAALKRNRTALQSLVQQAQAATGENTQRQSADTRFWVPTRDKAGHGYAVIRSLPGQEQALKPRVRYWDNFFKGTTHQ